MIVVLVGDHARLATLSGFLSICNNCPFCASRTSMLRSWLEKAIIFPSDDQVKLYAGIENVRKSFPVAVSQSFKASTFPEASIRPPGDQHTNDVFHPLLAPCVNVCSNCLVSVL